MKKFVIQDSSLQISKINCVSPSISGYDMLIEVMAGAINPVDLKVRAMFNGNIPKVLGYDGAGRVVEVGDLVTDFVPGDEVYYAGDISRDGSNASAQVVDSRIVAKRPLSISYEEASALPLTSITAYEALFSRMKIPKDSSDTVLIIGGAGGVGSIAIQLLKAITNCKVIATASREISEAWCLDLGADFVVDHSNPIKPQLDELGIGEVPYIFCANDTTYHWHNMVESIEPQGTICAIVDNSEPVALNALKRKSVTFVWEFMFTRPLFNTKDLRKQQELLLEITHLVDEGKIKSTAHRSLGVLSVDTLQKGHEMIESGHTIGKITWRNE